MSTASIYMADFQSAWYDSSTPFPYGFDPEKHKVLNNYSRKKMTKVCQIKIERMLTLEDRFGISIDGLYTETTKDDDDDEVEVIINGEILATDADKLPECPQIQLVWKNKRNQVIGVASAMLDEKFSGYQAFSETLYCKEFPTLVRIAPQEY